MAHGAKRLRVGVAVSALAVVVTAVAYIPSLLTDAGEFGDWPVAARFLWLGLLVVAAPVVTHVAVRRAPLLLSKAAILLLAVPQLLTLVILGWLDVWLEVHSGYLLDGSGEEAMAYGIGMMASTFLGGVIALLVFSAAAAAGRRVRSTAAA